jgi:hypothetical protein
MVIEQSSSNQSARIIDASQLVGHSPDDPGSTSLIPENPGVEVTTGDARRMLRQIANAYPEVESAANAIDAVIVNLETLRHEALLPLALGNLENVKHLLKQKSVVRIASPRHS